MNRRDGMKQTLEDYQQDMIVKTQRGYPILLVAAIYFYVLGFLSFYVDMKLITILWVIGWAFVFPLGMLFAKLFGVNLFVKKNPMGTLSSIVEGIQVFYIPIWIMVYQMATSYLPFAVGFLVASHFLSYAWIYRSEAYLWVSFATGFISLLLGTVFIQKAFAGVPFGIAMIYSVGVLWLIQENREDEQQKAGIV